MSIYPTSVGALYASALIDSRSNSTSHESVTAVLVFFWSFYKINGMAISNDVTNLTYWREFESTKVLRQTALVKNRRQAWQGQALSTQSIRILILKLTTSLDQNVCQSSTQKPRTIFVNNWQDAVYLNVRFAEKQRFATFENNVNSQFIARDHVVWQSS